MKGNMAITLKVNSRGRFAPKFTGFPIKDARLIKLKNRPNLLRDDSKGKRIENTDFKYFSNPASFMVNPVFFN